MDGLLRLSGAIDRLSAVFGRIGEYLLLLSCLISAGNAMSRYLFSVSSNAWLEIQWYMFGFVVLMGAAHTLSRNEHVRVDLIYGWVSERTRLWIDAFGIVFFLLPFALYAAWLSWPMFVLSFQQQEMSNNAGGLIRWPVKLTIPAGFALLALQGVSELIKRIAALSGQAAVQAEYIKPLQ